MTVSPRVVQCTDCGNNGLAVTQSARCSPYTRCRTTWARGVLSTSIKVACTQKGCKMVPTKEVPLVKHAKPLRVHSHIRMPAIDRTLRRLQRSRRPQITGTIVADYMCLLLFYWAFSTGRNAMRDKLPVIAAGHFLLVNVQLHRTSRARLLPDQLSQRNAHCCAQG